jgi:hypothetical protein
MRPSPRRVLCSSLVGVLAVGMTAVVSSPASARVASLPKACAFFTQEAAAVALGGPVNPGVLKKPNPRMTICKYTRTDGKGFGDVEVGPWEFVKPLGKTTKIKGLGAHAEGEDPFGVAVKKGDNGFNVNLSLQVGDFNGQAATDQAAANIAAETAAAKLLVPKFKG